MNHLKIGDEKVEAKTGKIWKEWFNILDKINAKDLGHAETAKKLSKEYQLSDWWSQTVTIRYEKEKGYWVRHGS